MTAPRILIIGGVAGGASAATRARRLNETADIQIMEKGDYVSFANCGLPYHIGGQIRDRDKLLVSTPGAFRKVHNINAHCGHEAIRIDRQGKRVLVREIGGQERWEEYDKLVLAPGASPLIPPLDGLVAANVFVLRDMADMDRIKAKVDEGGVRRAVVLGAGYIGLEMVEALHVRGVAVSLVEQQPSVLPLLDPEMAREVESVLLAKGVHVCTGTSATRLIVAERHAREVELADGRSLETDLVLVAVGVRPNIALAKDAGLTIGPSGAIAVNHQMQTNDPEIYAVGDAAEVVSAVTGQASRIPLAGPANRNGRNAGGHAAASRAFEAAPVAGTAIVGLFGKVAGMTGLSLKAARQAGFDAGASYAIRGHHVGYYPGAEPMILKVVYDRATGRVLGGQAVGGAGVDKRIDVIATAIHFRGTVHDLAGLDLAYAPQFGAAKDPIHIAAFGAENELNGLVRSLLPGDPPVGDQLVDVRSEDEFAGGALAGSINIPLPTLRQQLGELDRSKPVMVTCAVGERGYKACRILMQRGFPEVWNLAGGYRLHQRSWGGPA